MLGYSPTMFLFFLSVCFVVFFKISEAKMLLEDNFAGVVMAMFAGVKQLTFGTIQGAPSQLVNP